MVDAAVVMIENAHKHIEALAPRASGPGAGAPSIGAWSATPPHRWGPALFFSLLIITLSFVPVFTLEAQEGRLFSPLAYTKTYAMAAAAGLAVTLIPVLMGYLIRGRIPDEKEKSAEPRAHRDSTARCSTRVLRFPGVTLALALAVAAWRACTLRCAWAASSCRRWTKATFCTCPRRCPASPPARLPSCCSRPTA